MKPLSEPEDHICEFCGMTIPPGGKECPATDDGRRCRP